MNTIYSFVTLYLLGFAAFSGCSGQGSVQSQFADNTYPQPTKNVLNSDCNATIWGPFDSHAPGQKPCLTQLKMANGDVLDLSYYITYHDQGRFSRHAINEMFVTLRNPQGQPLKAKKVAMTFFVYEKHFADPFTKNYTLSKNVVGSQAVNCAGKITCSPTKPFVDAYYGKESLAGSDDSVLKTLGMNIVMDGVSVFESPFNFLPDYLKYQIESAR